MCIFDVMRYTRKWLNRNEAADFLEVSVRTIDRWTKEGRLTRYQSGPAKKILYNLKELKALAEPEPNYLPTNNAASGSGNLA